MGCISMLKKGPEDKGRLNGRSSPAMMTSIAIGGCDAACCSQHSTPSRCPRRCKTAPRRGKSECTSDFGAYLTAKADHTPNRLVKPDPYSAIQLPDSAPVIKSPFYIDYGNVRIAQTASIHRNVYLGDNPLPEAAIVIGEGAIICSNVQVLTIKHDVDWRQRDGFNGPGSASGVTIGSHAYIANGATIL